MEALLREAREHHGGIPPELKEKIVLQHTPLIRYIVNRIAVRLPSHIDLDDLQNTGVIGLMDAIDKYDEVADDAGRDTVSGEPGVRDLLEGRQELVIGEGHHTPYAEKLSSWALPRQALIS